MSCTDALWFYVVSKTRSGDQRTFNTEFRQNPLSYEYEQFTDIQYKSSKNITRTAQVPLAEYENEIEFVTVQVRSFRHEV